MFCPVKTKNLSKLSLINKTSSITQITINKQVLLNGLLEILTNSDMTSLPFLLHHSHHYVGMVHKTIRQQCLCH